MADQLLELRFKESAIVSNVKNNIDEFGLLVANKLEEHFPQLCEIALDLAVDHKGHVWLIEVNPKPAREVFAKLGQKHIYRKAIIQPLKYAQYLYNEHANMKR